MINAFPERQDPPRLAAERAVAYRLRTMATRPAQLPLLTTQSAWCQLVTRTSKTPGG